MMKKTYDLLIVGEINPDLILTSDDIEPVFGQVEKLISKATLTIGSSSAIVASGTARLGLRTAILGLVGDDLFGRFMMEALIERGIDVSNIIVSHGKQTGFSVILARQSDRAILTFIGVMESLEASRVQDDLLRASRHIHVGSYFLQTALRPGLPDLFRRARTLGLSTSLDTNWDPSTGWAGVSDVLPHTSIFLPNEAEALSLTGESELSTALGVLAEQTPVVAIKLGQEGAVAQRKGETVWAKALPIEVIDTVGAGDSFDAGFLYAHLQSWPLARALRLATVCGSLSTRAQGGTLAQPTILEAMAYLDAERCR